MAQELKIPIIYEDQDILVVCKPVGVVVARAETVKEETIQDWASLRYEREWLGYKDSSDEVVRYFLERKGLVHRLDRETSGVMVIARTPEAFADLLMQFKDRKVEKEYAALTHGLWKAKEGSIVLPVGRMRYDSKVFGVRADGRKAETRYKVEAEFRSWNLPKEVDATGYQGFSYINFYPKTGRTHQIRVHAKHVGHQIVGDYIYTSEKRLKEDKKWAGRTLLFAKRIAFFHPRTHARVEHRCEPAELKRILQSVFGFLSRE